MQLFRRLTGKVPRPDSYWGYCKYALGEITLVVVGILIAVALNNWNERRKDAAALDHVLAVVQADLRHDQTETAHALEFYEAREPIFDLVLAGQLSAEDYAENPGYAFLLIGYPQVSYQHRGFDLLMEFDGEIPAQRQALVDQVIAFYTEREVEVSVDDQLRADDFAENFSHFKANMPWWADLIHRQVVDDFIPYAVGDPDYRNRVATSHFLAYRVFVPELEKFQGQAEDLLTELGAL